MQREGTFETASQARMGLKMSMECLGHVQDHSSNSIGATARMTGELFAMSIFEGKH